MTQEYLQAQLTQIQQSLMEICRVQGSTAATVEAIEKQVSQALHSQEACRNECAAHRKGIWDALDDRAKSIEAIRVDAASETGTNRTNWKTWTSIALLVLGNLAGWMFGGKH